MTAFFHRLALFLALVVIVLPAHAPLAEADRCFDDWSDAAPIMVKEGLLATKDLHEQARQHLAGSLLRVTLCQDGARYVYRLLMRESSGRLNLLTVDARRPFDH